MQSNTTQRGRNLRRRAESRILPEDTVPQAARKILRPHVRRIFANEKGTREGEDPEKLHEMRVAVRRARTTLKVFAEFLDPDEFEPFVQELRTLGRTLGPVRDADVWIADANRFREGLPVGARLDLDAVLREWTANREKLRRRMLAHFESARYRRFKKGFPRFLEEEVAGQPPEKDGRIRPVRLRHLGPVILGGRLASIRAYDDQIEGREVPLGGYHRLRIEIKRLRYTLEFLSDITGPEADPLIATLKRAQDHLGELREAWMIAEVLDRMLAMDDGRGRIETRHPGIVAYLVVQRARCEKLIESFPYSWATICNPEFNRRVAAIAAAF